MLGGVIYTELDGLREGLDLLINLLPVLIPLAIVQLGLLLFAAVDVVRKRRTKNLSPIIWVLIICLVNMIGPILYFIFGRAEDSGGDDRDDI